MDYKDILKTLNETLPPIFKRKDLGKLTHGVIDASMLSTMKRGFPKPEGALLGKYVVYERDKFLKWAEEYYGSFSKYGDDGFVGTKVRRNQGAAGKAGSGGEEAKGGGGRGES